MANPNGRSLCLLKKDQDGYYLDHACQAGDGQEEESVDRLWLVARSLKNENGKYDYKIQKFDAIKLGRVRFRVKDFRCDQQQMSEEELYQQELREAMEVKGPKDCADEDQDHIQCRICWGNEEDEETNPLILACKCKGSVGLIHFQCLKSWVLTQKQEKPMQQQQNVRSFYWKRFECEICKHMYPYTFKIERRIFKIIDLTQEIASANGANYILLESMPLDKNTSRNIHLLCVTKEQNEFKLGRGHESQVRINDISVSRCHAIIKCKPDGFYIEDNTSKFGTIILLKNKLRLKASHTMAVQVGRTVISFTIKYVQSEKEKLKSDISKVLDSNKNKKTLTNGPEGGILADGQFNVNANPQNYPLEMQRTFAANYPMENSNDKQGDDDENGDMNDN